MNIYISVEFFRSRLKCHPIYYTTNHTTPDSLNESNRDIAFRYTLTQSCIETIICVFLKDLNNTIHQSKLTAVTLKHLMYELGFVRNIVYP